MYALILLILVCVISGLFLYFFIENKKIKQRHYHDIHDIKQSISIHKTQLNFRKKGLENYHFLKYNLEESLVLQPKINLK